jgi:serine/threonine protein phosphatase PrpC
LVYGRLRGRARAGHGRTALDGPGGADDDAGMVHVLSFTEAGVDHADNEDAFLVRTHPAAGDSWLCFLAAGQGGQAGGGPAARLACEVALDQAVRRPPSRLADILEWDVILRQADHAVSADPQAGFTTLVGLSIVAGVIVGASSGDSAVLAVHGDGEAERLTARQHKNPPVGSGGALFAPFTSGLRRPWRVLVLSDGVWKYVGWDRLVEAAREHGGQALLDALQSRARLRVSGRFTDDFTAVLLEES